MINEHNQLLKPKEKLETSSIGVELGNLTEATQKRWSIYDESDIDSVVRGICRVIDEAAIPYIKKFGNMESVLVMMLRDDQEIWTFAPIHHRRAMNAIGLAKILGKDNIKRINEDKKAFLSDRNDFGLALFNDFSERIVEK